MYIYDEKANEWVSHRDTAEYRQRKRVAKDAWIGLGIVMLLMPPAAIILFGFFGIFATFSYLDEVPYDLSWR